MQLLTLRALAHLVTELTIRSKSADNPLRGAVCLQRYVPPVGVKASLTLTLTLTLTPTLTLTGAAPRA